MDEPTQLPEGTVVELTVVDGGDELDDQERFRLHEALSESWDQARKGQTRPAEDLLNKLR